MSLTFVCPWDDCRFSVHSDSEYEIFDAVYEHSREVHDATLSGTEVRENVVDAGERWS